MDYTSIKVGQLPTDAIANENLIPHEVGGLLKKATIADLAAFIGSSSAVGFRAVQVDNGETLPTTTQQEFILVGPGTYNNVGGGSPITVTEELNALVSNGTFWFIGVEIPIEATAGGTAIWGGIGGTLADQTDLQTALNTKEPSITSGTTAQYWRGDKSWQTLNKAAVGLGNVDNTSDANKPISTATQTALDNTVKLTTDQSISGVKTFTSLSKFTNDSAALFAVEIDTITSDALVVKDSGTTKLQIGKNGEILAAKYKISGGFNTQFLKANGDLDSNTYALDSDVVNLTDSQTIEGTKTFDGSVKFNSIFTQFEAGGFFVKIPSLSDYNAISAVDGGFNFNQNTGTSFRFEMRPEYIKFGDGGHNATLSTTDLTFSRTFNLPDANGTIALTSNIPTVSGTTNYLPKFTGTSAIGNSLIYDNGTNVGIGTTSPSSKLTINGRTDFWSSEYGWIHFDSSSTNQYLASIKGIDTFMLTTGKNGANTQPALLFGTSDVERMRITSGGNVVINNLGTGTVYSNAGTLTNTNPSDERLKENITDLGYGLNEILQLRPVSYNWINDTANQGTQFGFIAQEVQEIMPELINEFTITEDDEEVVRLGLDKEAIFVTLVNAIKELKAEIELLKGKN